MTTAQRNSAATLLALLLVWGGHPASAQFGGPDPYGYKWSDTTPPLDGYQPTYNYTPILGTPVSLTDDSLSAALALGFPFTFYGTVYLSAYISSNGFVSFTGDANGCCSGTNPPNAGTPNGFAAFNWNDLNPGCSGGGTISYATGGIAPNRYWVCEFNNVLHYSVCSYPVAVQTWLYETSNEIVMQIQSATADGTNTTIGIENAAGSIGLLYASSMAAGAFRSLVAVRYFVTPPASLTATATPTLVGTATATSTATETILPVLCLPFSCTQTNTLTRTPSGSYTRTATDSVSATTTETATWTETASATGTLSESPTPPPTGTDSPTASRTATPTGTASATPPPTPTKTPTVGAGASGPVQVAPNPVSRADGVVRFFGLAPTDVLHIYDVAGERIAELRYDPASGAVEWRLVDPSGRRVPAGVYAYRSRERSKTGFVAVLR